MKVCRVILSKSKIVLFVVVLDRIFSKKGATFHKTVPSVSFSSISLENLASHPTPGIQNHAIQALYGKYGMKRFLEILKKAYSLY